MEQNLDRAEAIIDAYGCDQSNLIAIMQEIQGEYKYLSEGALTLIAEKLGISTAKVYSCLLYTSIRFSFLKISASALHGMKKKRSGIFLLSMWWRF